MTVEFIRKSEEPYATSADVLIDGIQWEMKSPKSGKLKWFRRTFDLRSASLGTSFSTLAG